MPIRCEKCDFTIMMCQCPQQETTEDESKKISNIQLYDEPNYPDYEIRLKFKNNRYAAISIKKNAKSDDIARDLHELAELVAHTI